jgi:hypothetical protein
MYWREAFVTSIGPGYFGGSTASTWLRVLRDNQFAVDLPYWPRALVITLGSFENSLLAGWEKRRARTTAVCRVAVRIHEEHVSRAFRARARSHRQGMAALFRRVGVRNPMSDTVENLILDLLEWIGSKERTYQETLDAWRTSCPKLPVWEDANDRGLVDTASVKGCSLVRLTPAGLALLMEQRPRSAEIEPDSVRS